MGVTARADAGCGKWIEAEKLDLPHSGWTPLGGSCLPILVMGGRILLLLDPTPLADTDRSNAVSVGSTHTAVFPADLTDYRAGRPKIEAGETL